MFKNGFKTASGKVVKISEKSLEIAKTLFRDIGEIPIADDTKIPTNISICDQKRFSSLPAKSPITDTVEKSKAECEDDNLLTLAAMSIGFQTASGKVIKISEKSLEHAKRLFHDNEIHEEARDKIPTKRLFKDLIEEDGFDLAEFGPTEKKYKPTEIEDCSLINIDKSYGQSSISQDTKSNDVDELGLMEKEILDSTLALLADEEANETVFQTDEEEKHELGPMEQEILDCTFALLADEEANESALQTDDEENQIPIFTDEPNRTTIPTEGDIDDCFGHTSARVKSSTECSS